MEWKYTDENPLRVVTLCSGYDSQLMAIRNLGIPYECVGWSEIDKYAIMAHDAVFPEIADRNLGDMTKIDWGKVGDFDLLFYSTPCFVAGTKVLTEVGYKNIEEISIGDKVLTRDCSWRVVENSFCSGKKRIFRVKAGGSLPIECTDTHPFLVRTRKRVWHNDIRRWRFEYTEPEKVRVNGMVAGKSFIGIPIIKEEKHLDMSDELLWLLGRYVADGHLYRRDKQVILSIGKDKVDAFEKMVSMDHNLFKHAKSCYRAVFYKDSPLYKLVETGFLGYGSEYKFINPIILSAEKAQLRAFLDGYMSGDGSFIEKTYCYEATTISINLAHSIVLAVQKVYGVGCKLYFMELPKTHIIEGRVVNQKDQYMVRWRVDSPKHQWFNDGDYIWWPVKEIQDTGREENVYNLTVEGNHTYTANNICVFNCTDFSNAGKQAGGEEGSGTRSSILWFTRNAIIEKRPKYLVMENVKALVSEKFRPLFLKWCDELTGYGYTNFMQVLNAKDYGVPQNRERIFVVSILGDAWFTFPQPRELKLRLKDLLEEKVDEKYYLAQDKVNQFIESLDDEKLKLIEKDSD